MSATYGRAMPVRSTLPHGSWPTRITSALVVRAAVRLEEVGADGGAVWWSESRPGEGGRSALVRRRVDGTAVDVLPAPWNARTRVHEYGGGAWAVADGVLWFTHFPDQPADHDTEGRRAGCQTAHATRAWLRRLRG